MIFKIALYDPFNGGEASFKLNIVLIRQYVISYPANVLHFLGESTYKLFILPVHITITKICKIRKKHYYSFIAI